MTLSAKPIRKILVANRGEIACRVFKTCKALGIRTVAVYSDADTCSPHVKMADEAVHIGPPIAAESYLDQDKIVGACLATGADAVHPGYGFLSENAEFATRCASNGITFIGPRPESMAAIGDKINSKLLLASKAPQVPLLPGYNGLDQSSATLTREAMRIGFPILLKASAGGGGKGMRVVREALQLAEEIASAQGEAQRSFGDARLLIEKYIETARHIEVQIFGDLFGGAVALFERECSVQRRHQKIIEECPSPFLTPSLREKMTSSAVDIAKLISYVGAGTVEFIVDGATGHYYFLEVNTRLQVEHPVTEAVTGLDLVALQIWVAQGGKLQDFLDRAGGVKMKGHAIEVRIYAEDPSADFFPATGTVSKWNPASHLVRVDSGIAQGGVVTSYYDPLIAKLTAHAPTRGECIERMRGALGETTLLGLPAHNVGFLFKVLESAEFACGAYDTGVVGRLMKMPDGVVEEVLLQRFVTGVVGAMLFGWALKRGRRRVEGTAYRRVRPGFRNVPYTVQRVRFELVRKVNGLDASFKSILVEYDLIADHEGRSAHPQFRVKVSGLVPPASKDKVRQDQQVAIWEGEVELVDSKYNEFGPDWVNACIRLVCGEHFCFSPIHELKRHSQIMSNALYVSPPSRKTCLLTLKNGMEPS
ncbi:carbamoyl-phosphate synthase L chain, ATP binding domain-containing protein [Chytriomyces sp. MP71]|nr:carbamoyl-phosphate synthase L chain, ATP binding domain-containing protein [Chytriomyces sp. MP71]